MPNNASNVSGTKQHAKNKLLLTCLVLRILNVVLVEGFCMHDRSSLAYSRVIYTYIMYMLVGLCFSFHVGKVSI